MTDYTYNVSTDTTNGIVDSGNLISEIRDSAIVTSLDGVSTLDDVLTITFKADLSVGDKTILDGLVTAHTGDVSHSDPEIRTTDGRLRVRSDSLPVGTTTTFTSQGDSATVIGGGQDAFWDFSNTDNDVTAPTGFKRKVMKLTFVDPVYIKEGAIYYHDALKGSYADVKVLCPAGAYYLDRDGIPTLAATDTPLGWMIRKHFMAGSVPLGDELNTEVAQDTAVPPGYILCIEITVPDTDVSSFGWGSIELYRTRTVLFPGEAV